MLGAILGAAANFIPGLGALNKLGLRKMLIIAYCDDSYSLLGIRGFTTVNLDYNGFAQNFNVNYVENKTNRITKPNLKFAGAGDQTMNVNLIFDSTGLVESSIGSLAPVSTQITWFKHLTLDVHGTTHKPYNLRMIWGRQMFKGVLKSLNVNYEQFAPGGFPIRAKATATFSASEESLLGSLLSALESPDMTHTRTAKEGLPLTTLCRQVYSDPSLYLNVARHNDLDQFRKLEPGTKIEFPPLE